MNLRLTSCRSNEFKGWYLGLYYCSVVVVVLLFFFWQKWVNLKLSILLIRDCYETTKGQIRNKFSNKERTTFNFYSSIKEIRIKLGEFVLIFLRWNSLPFCIVANAFFSFLIKLYKMVDNTAPVGVQGTKWFWLHAVSKRISHFMLLINILNAVLNPSQRLTVFHLYLKFVSIYKSIFEPKKIYFWLSKALVFIVK